MGALSFQAPLVLAGLLSLPALWWLLRAIPPAPTQRVFGGTFFMRDLDDETVRPARTPWWLLVLRLLAMGLIFLALSGPVLNAPADRVSNQPLLIILDDTWPAAPTWRERQAAVAALAAAPGARNRTGRLLTSADGVLSPPQSLTALAEAVKGRVPAATLADRGAMADLLAAEAALGEQTILWLSDGTIGRTEDDRRFLQAVGDGGEVTLWRVPGAVTLALSAMNANANPLSVEVTRIGGAPVEGRIAARARDGRSLGEFPFDLPQGQRTAEAEIDLPLTLRNEISRLTIVGQRSAGATWLVDGGARRIRAGLVATGQDSLLDGGFYIEQALADRALLEAGDIETLARPETSLIVLSDIGTLRGTDADRLAAWVAEGGVLVRFAGPATANAAGTDGFAPETFPVRLRGGERSFGGALTWAAPQAIAAFSSTGPFADLDPADAGAVRRQVLSEPGGDLAAEVWASLEDGTPLVTARPSGEGMLVLFHVTATPTWSDLPVSGLFPAMLGRLARLASGAGQAVPQTALAPYRLLDGYGALTTPPAGAAPQRFDGEGEMVPPGLYGPPDAAYAVNTYTDESPRLDPMVAQLLPADVRLRGPDGDDIRAFGPPLLALALILLALDAVVLAVRALHERRALRPSLVTLVALLVGGMGGALDPAAAQVGPRPALSDAAIEAANAVRFAYLKTGDREVDRLSQAGLFGLTAQAARRSALEPGMPAGVDAEQDDLSVYPLIYWPIVEGSPAPTDAALAQLETYMAAGGLLLIDTRDGERQNDLNPTAAQQQLRQILLRMNVPPLEPMGADHILGKSFYRLDDLHGRNTGGTIWVEAGAALRETTDGVPSLVIGARDWAAAWAVDDNGRYLRPPGPGGPARREYAYRAGINIAMVALTGNYKGDQVHVQALLDRLGPQQAPNPQEGP